MASSSDPAPLLPGSLRARLEAWLRGALGCVLLTVGVASAASLLTWSIADPSFTHATNGPTRNLLGPIGAIISDLAMQLLGLAGVFIILLPVFWGLQLVAKQRLDGARVKLVVAPVAVVLLACAASSLPKVAAWPLSYGFGGLLGDQALKLVAGLLGMIKPERASAAAGLFGFAGGLMLLMTSLGLSHQDLKLLWQRPRRFNLRMISRGLQRFGNVAEGAGVVRREPILPMPPPPPTTVHAPLPRSESVFASGPRVTRANDFRSAPPDEDLIGSELPSDEDSDADGAKRMAEIFAPEIRTMSPSPSETPSLVMPPLRPAAQSDAADAYGPIGAKAVMSHDATGRSPNRSPRSARAPVIPRQRPKRRPAEPAPTPPSEPSPRPAGWRPQGQPGGDDLYGRAVVIVLGARKASTDYLQQRLGIGYMRAADLIERMEREGILGAPVYGMRPILNGARASRVV